MSSSLSFFCFVVLTFTRELTPVYRLVQVNTENHLGILSHLFTIKAKYPDGGVLIMRNHIKTQNLDHLRRKKRTAVPVLPIRLRKCLLERGLSEFNQ